ncbi:hypothetical protein EZJ49_02500 [Bdellovibrio bacteriovorus]|uniref:hypothetical protein n=1 Tax=Bdellovibrio bacteriovorus TaxID=959 RepID=UPI0021D196E9|nr:hypothetical protein [Bdellovibrio bacteriovorus]UXR65117.1 hypothetical protein EZJ49_02500 [Bdellovibrio bacteriovorus]
MMTIRQWSKLGALSTGFLLLLAYQNFTPSNLNAAATCSASKIAEILAPASEACPETAYRHIIMRFLLY